MDQDNILDNLTTINGKEEFEPQKPAKKASSKTSSKTKTLRKYRGSVVEA